MHFSQPGSNSCNPTPEKKFGVIFIHLPMTFLASSDLKHIILKVLIIYGIKKFSGCYIKEIM